MKTYSRLTLASLLLILVVPQVGADEQTNQEPVIGTYQSGKKKSEDRWKDDKRHGLQTSDPLP